MSDRAHDGIRREAAKRAERAEFHRLAKLLDQREIGRAVHAIADFVDGFQAARRANAAGRTFSAGFECAKFEGETCLGQHIHAVVEYDDATMADKTVAGSKCFVIERRIE